MTGHSIVAPAAPPRQGFARWQLTASWEAANRLRMLTLVAIGGLLLGGAMAVFGLPHANMHTPLHTQFGIMLPGCGGTRSVYYAMRGQWATSFEYNPVGVPLVIGAVLLVLRQIVGMLTGRWLTPRIRMPRPLIAVLVVAAIVALEVNQQFHAALLMRP